MTRISQAISAYRRGCRPKIAAPLLCGVYICAKTDISYGCCPALWPSKLAPRVRRSTRGHAPAQRLMACPPRAPAGLRTRATPAPCTNAAHAAAMHAAAHPPQPACRRDDVPDHPPAWVAPLALRADTTQGSRSSRARCKARHQKLLVGDETRVPS